MAHPPNGKRILFTESERILFPNVPNAEERYGHRVVVLKETLAILYGLEHLILVEYVESFVPFCYASYLVTTFFSSNQVFFTDMSDETTISIKQWAWNTMFYGILEWLSFVGLVLFVKWRFNMNLLYHLAFVLETHFASIQGKLAFFLIAALNFNLIHFGMFSFSSGEFCYVD